MMNMSLQHFWAAPMAAELCAYHSKQTQNRPVKLYYEPLQDFLKTPSVAHCFFKAITFTLEQNTLDSCQLTISRT